MPSQGVIQVRRKGGNSAPKAASRGEVEGESQQVGTCHLGEVEAAGRISPIWQACSIFVFLSGCFSNSLPFFLFSDSPRPLGKEE